MGKKLNQASLKISKNEKQQFNSLIKFLRPKVYITDSSSFKKLVQELTGNGSSTTPSPAPSELNIVENFPLIGAEVQRDHPETSVEVSVSTEATTSSCESCYTALMNEEFNQVCNQITSVEFSVSTEATTGSSNESCYNAPMNDEFNQVCNQICLEDVVLNDSVASQPLDHLWAYQNLESLLFDDELNPFFNCYAQLEQEVSIYDYELSGVL